MKKNIHISGASGSGKTTLGNKLKETFDISRIKSYVLE